MSWRMRLADWISGGELSRVREYNADLHKELIACFHYEEALLSVVAMETPNCAPIGKRMAKAAREAME